MIGGAGCWEILSTLRHRPWLRGHWLRCSVIQVLFMRRRLWRFWWLFFFFSEVLPKTRCIMPIIWRGLFLLSFMLLFLFCPRNGCYYQNCAGCFGCFGVLIFPKFERDPLEMLRGVIDMHTARKKRFIKQRAMLRSILDLLMSPWMSHYSPQKCGYAWSKWSTDVLIMRS